MEEALLNTGVAIETVKAMLASIARLPGADQRQIAIARTHFETAFLWAGNAAHGVSVLPHQEVAL